MKWTRVIHEVPGDLEEVKLFDIEDDIKENQLRKERGGSPDNDERRLMFHPKSFAKTHKEFRYSDWEMSEP